MSFAAAASEREWRTYLNEQIYEGKSKAQYYNSPTRAQACSHRPARGQGEGQQSVSLEAVPAEDYLTSSSIKRFIAWRKEKATMVIQLWWWQKVVERRVQQQLLQQRQQIAALPVPPG